MTTEKTKYRFISDPGHGWIEVPWNEVIELDIFELISSCSYVDRKGAYCYLEEDCDLSVWAVAMGFPHDEDAKHCEKPTPWQTFWDERIISVYEENTSIRNMAPFPEADGYSYAKSFEYRYGRPYVEPQWMKESKAKRKAAGLTPL